MIAGAAEVVSGARRRGAIRRPKAQEREAMLWGHESCSRAGWALAAAWHHAASREAGAGAAREEIGRLTVTRTVPRIAALGRPGIVRAGKVAGARESRGAETSSVNGTRRLLCSRVRLGTCSPPATPRLATPQRPEAVGGGQGG